jgi:hypothetical protein
MARPQDGVAMLYDFPLYRALRRRYFIALCIARSVLAGTRIHFHSFDFVMSRLGPDTPIQARFP